VKDAGTGMLTAPWLNAPTKTEQVHKLKEYSFIIIIERLEEK